MKTLFDKENMELLWNSFAKEINGKFELKEILKANINSWVLVPTINYERNNHIVKIKQALFILSKKDYSPDPIKFILEKEAKREFKLSYWRKDFFDKIFTLNKRQTGNKEFDEIFCVKSNNSRDVIRFFSNAKIREALLEDKNLLLKVTAQKKRINVEMIHRKYIKNINELRRLNNIYQEIINTMIEIGVL